ncbi:2-isopropylmalate synthase [Paucidesulfovibrio gracilis DSM 16080]|uniref:Citramalate synthase n=1 Tax=Paucidesulfovibrio gracilis DSM 16080 TaxID=1121449 RepID=A0A1T4WTP0_9BACT|nr:citramalate synthase [Paucidesulfovibrio gracilis]SKA80696.1 2-isopropylmalate synthase [Paucidesulfovibrio gracilis DSM 16080]
MKKISLYDTTLRDGTQAEELNLTTEDKIRVARKLDELGLHYIEGGWPGSNPTDKQFFREIRKHRLSTARITAFGSTHYHRTSAEQDPNLASLLEAETPVLTIFGKTWDLHARTALGVSLERNLELIHASLEHLRPHVDELFFDAEHFFDGYKANPAFTLDCMKTAHEAGADILVLCDTNGGTLPHEIVKIMADVQKHLPDAQLGIHTHNDSELAVANALVAVQHGAVQVQGTINGYGERCGNANLCSIIPCLELKMGLDCLGAERLKMLRDTANYVSEVANLRPFLRQPFVGAAAFAHKGGIHVSAVLKDSETYEHIRPESVGNHQRVLLSDLAGKSNILFKAKQCGFDVDRNDPRLEILLDDIKAREEMGYEYSVADASFELLLREKLECPDPYFTFHNFFVLDSKREEDELPLSEATVIVSVRGERAHTAASGNGPVNALDRAVRKALERFYPRLKEVRLKDFKVRVVSGVLRDTGGTASFVRVLVESSDGQNHWTTVGVSHNIIEASWQAVVDSINYKIHLDECEAKAGKGDPGAP